MEDQKNRYGKIRKKDDETYIIEFNGLPFHVTPDYPSAALYGPAYIYEAVKAYADEHPDEVEPYEVPETTRDNIDKIESDKTPEA